LKGCYINSIEIEIEVEIDRQTDRKPQKNPSEALKAWLSNSPKQK